MFLDGLKYNYVIFNSVDSKLRYNEKGYYTICVNDLLSFNNIKVIWAPLSESNHVLRYLYNIHLSARINNKIRLPFKKIWNPLYFKNTFKDNKPICFVLMDRIPISCCTYLKHKYPNSRFVAMYRDVIKITQELYPDHPNNPIFDLQMTIDKKEAKKYNWFHFDEFESKINVPISEDYPLSDVFFAGKAKDRLPRLLEAYSIFTKAGLKCSYYLTGVLPEDRVELPNVVYADKFMPYSEMLYNTVNSRCVLEINQEEALGYTSRFLEAVMFNKRLITDNLAVKESKFYSPENIQCVSNVSEIDPEFVKNNNVVDYHYNNEFSPVHVIKKIDSELIKLYGDK